MGIFLLPDKTNFGWRIEPPFSVNFTTQYNSILARGAALGYQLPSPKQRVKQNLLISTLISSGLWDMMDVFYVYATDGDRNFATLNWKSPTQFQCALVSSPIFTVNKGFKGDAVAANIDTNFNPAVSGVNYTLNSANRFCWISTVFSASNITDGISAATSNTMRNASSVAQRINQTGVSLPVNINLGGTGLKSLNRTDASTVTAFSNNAAAAGSPQTVASTSIASANQLLFKVSSSFGDPQVGIYGMGTSMDSVNSSLFSALSAYMGSL